jgi:hypothetical protein
MGVGGQCHTPAALPAGKTRHLVKEAVWAPGSDWTDPEYLEHRNV